jgi:long-chain acyl-CoA synthetase
MEQMMSKKSRSQLSQWVEAMFAIDPGAAELEFGGVWRTWKNLDDESAALSEMLAGQALGTGTRIGILLRNRSSIVGALLAIFRSDRCAASINASAPDDKLAVDIRSAATPILVGTKEDWSRPGVKAAAAEIGALGISLDFGGATWVDGLPGERSLWTRPNAPGVSIEMLSSGTTGAPKRIPLSIAKFEKALQGAAAFEKGRGTQDVPRLRSGTQIVTAPLAHIAGITGVMNNILAGRKICLIEKFSVEAFRDAIVRHRPKVAGAPPSALRMILDANLPKADLSSLAAYRTGTAPLDPDLADAFYERYGIPVLQNYGATEFAGGVAGWTLQDFHDHWKIRRGSVGRINRGIEARVVDPETGGELAMGETGLLELRGGNIGASAWVRTTDLATVDEERFLWIKGRADGAIIRGGFKILPDDVIKAIESHPSVREAAVAGVADQRLGAVPVAGYILKSGADPVEPDVMRAYLKERLMPYQVPVHLRVFDDFPRTPSMKVSQPEFREMFAD